jgi:hypothetical protein
MAIKLTYDTVRESFESKGYILLSTEYVNNATKLNYKCPKGHEHSIAWNHWQEDRGCPTCAGNNKPVIEHIIRFFEKEDYTLLSTEYINARTKLDYKCPNGHENSIRWGNWNQGKRCPTCKNIKFSGSGNPSWKGGISYEPYCPIWSDKEYKQDIRNRDGNKCLNPTCKKKDHRLHIHHINYNKKSCSPSNVITLCGSCNTTANNNREWHTAWYKALMYMRYNYK